MYKPYHKRYIQVSTKSSPTLDAVLAYVYRKENLVKRCGRYADKVIDGLIDLGLVEKVLSKKGTFYFKTQKAKTFKAIDFAKEFLWAFHNTDFRKIINGKKYILCFNDDIEKGSGLIEINIALKKGYV